MPRLILPTVLSAALLILAPAAGAVAVPGQPGLPPGWSHADINVVVRHVPHTLSYDQGRVQAVTPTSLTLRELDGSVVTIAVSSATRVVIDGRVASIAAVRPLENAIAVSIDGAPAAKVTVRIPPRLAAILATGARRGSSG